MGKKNAAFAASHKSYTAALAAVKKESSRIKKVNGLAKSFFIG